MSRSVWKAVAAGSAVLGAAGLALILGSKKKTPTQAAPPSSQRVALIGDSYAVGLGPQLAKLLPNFQYEGHVGISTPAWLACGTCGTWLPAFKPDVVLVSLGVNDGPNPATASYQTIVQALHGIGARVVWIEPPAAVSTPSRAIIKSLGVPTVPGYSMQMASDGLHPANYAPWAQQIAQTLSSVA